eukprot:1624692-Amphidinium_carterae.1
MFVRTVECFLKRALEEGSLSLSGSLLDFGACDLLKWPKGLSNLSQSHLSVLQARAERSTLDSQDLCPTSAKFIGL